MKQLTQKATAIAVNTVALIALNVAASPVYAEDSAVKQIMDKVTFPDLESSVILVAGAAIAFYLAMKGISVAKSLISRL